MCVLPPPLALLSHCHSFRPPIHPHLHVNKNYYPYTHYLSYYVLLVNGLVDQVATNWGDLQHYKSIDQGKGIII